MCVHGEARESPPMLNPRVLKVMEQQLSSPRPKALGLRRLCGPESSPTLREKAFFAWQMESPGSEEMA